MEELMNQPILLAVILVLVLLLYALIAIFLNRLNNLVNKKKTIMAWLPLFNIYLLGKLTVNRVLGIVLVICIFALNNSIITIGDFEIDMVWLPDNIGLYLQIGYFVILLLLVLAALFKYIKLSTVSHEEEYNVEEMEEESLEQLIDLEFPINKSEYEEDLFEELDDELDKKSESISITESTLESSEEKLEEDNTNNEKNSKEEEVIDQEDVDQVFSELERLKTPRMRKNNIDFKKK